MTGLIKSTNFVFYSFFTLVHIHFGLMFIHTLVNELCGDCSAKYIYKFKSKKCQGKNIFPAQDRVASTASKQSFDFVTPFDPVYLDCHSTNFVYVITCSRSKDK